MDLLQNISLARLGKLASDRTGLRAAEESEYSITHQIAALISCSYFSISDANLSRAMIASGFPNEAALLYHTKASFLSSETPAPK